MKLQPLADRVVLKVKEAEVKTASGLFMPEESKEKPVQAEVVAVGPGTYSNGVKVEMEVSVGDTVIYSKFAGTEIDVDGVSYLIIRQSDILAILK
ncbi:MAG: co-chaperone GroES [Eubacteriaceae bacterium]|nr:co-chaperone GroES [Eubacteriaceae bacterium]